MTLQRLETTRSLPSSIPARWIPPSPSATTRGEAMRARPDDTHSPEDTGATGRGDRGRGGRRRDHRRRRQPMDLRAAPPTAARTRGSTCREETRNRAPTRRRSSDTDAGTALTACARPPGQTGWRGMRQQRRQPLHRDGGRDRRAATSVARICHGARARARPMLATSAASRPAPACSTDTSGDTGSTSARGQHEPRGVHGGASSCILGAQYARPTR